MSWWLQLTCMRYLRQRGEKYGCATIREGGIGRVSSLQRRFAIRMLRCGGSGALQPGEGGSSSGYQGCRLPAVKTESCRIADSLFEILSQRTLTIYFKI